MTIEKDFLFKGLILMRGMRVYQKDSHLYVHLRVVNNMEK